jgi:hypothetical protein
MDKIKIVYAIKKNKQDVQHYDTETVNCGLFKLPILLLEEFD